jgi:hypothetical protein
MEETIRNHIRKQIVKMMEQENPKFIPVPYHVQPILKTLGLFPFNRYVSEVKHANTVPASEEINLVNGSKFFIYFGENKEVEIGGEKFFLDDYVKYVEIKKIELNIIKTKNILKKQESMLIII